MPPENRLTMTRTRESRDRVIAALSDHFAHDALDVDEFERRITVAHTSESADEIDALLSDLPALAPASPISPAPKTAPALVPASQVRAEQTMFAIMGGVDRRGAWSVPRRLRVVTMMGGAHLDLREARFPPGPVDIEVFAFMGGIEIIVPPGLAIETHGSAIMGGFQEVNRASAHPDADAPLLRVHGFVMMGGVDIRMRLPGESDRDAHRRQRRERKEERRALKDEHHARRALDRTRER
jgi:Domain of unknown function (DUF1707)/Cell wall-active antibiotics response 4TMS YvqF